MIQKPKNVAGVKDMSRGKEAKTPNQIEEWMMDSLLSLMKEKPFREIRITEIAERAQSAR